jgi:hypothetical protein
MSWIRAGKKVPTVKKTIPLLRKGKRKKNYVENKVNNPIGHTYELVNFQGDVGVGFGVELDRVVELGRVVELDRVVVG